MCFHTLIIRLGSRRIHCRKTSSKIINVVNFGTSVKFSFLDMYLQTTYLSLRQHQINKMLQFCSTKGTRPFDVQEIVLSSVCTKNSPKIPAPGDLWGREEPLYAFACVSQERADSEVSRIVGCLAVHPFTVGGTDQSNSEVLGETLTLLENKH